MTELAMHLDLMLLDAEEPVETIEEIGDMVGSDEPGMVLKCQRCDVKRYVPSHGANKYAKTPATEEFQLLHGACVGG